MIKFCNYNTAKTNKSVNDLNPTFILFLLLKKQIVLINCYYFKMIYKSRILTLIVLILTVNSLNIPLPRSRETCMVITQGNYEFEYVVSGVN